MSKPPAGITEADIGTRLKNVRATLGLTGAVMARRLDITRPYWSALENGKRPLGKKLLSTLERVFAVRPEYVANGLEPMFHRLTSKSQHVDECADIVAAQKAPKPLMAGESNAPWDGKEMVQTPWVLALPTGENEAALRRYEVIPKIIVTAEAHQKRLGEPGTLDWAGDFAFSLEWLRRHLGHTSGRLATLQVCDDAMRPGLHEGDTVVVDTGVRRIETSGIYVLALHGDRLVRRVQRLLDDSLVIMSDNPAYGKETVPQPRARSLEVVGRVVWPRIA